MLHQIASTPICIFTAVPFSVRHMSQSTAVIYRKRVQRMCHTAAKSIWAIDTFSYGPCCLCSNSTRATHALHGGNVDQGNRHFLVPVLSVFKEHSNSGAVDGHKTRICGWTCLE
eukprot:m.44576 g.44576  ORF g.44576 m.44576 type:complete len:114 (-) comp15097_c0_seq4:1112-1453(-)